MWGLLGFLGLGSLYKHKWITLGKKWCILAASRVLLSYNCSFLSNLKSKNRSQCLYQVKHSTFTTRGRYLVIYNTHITISVYSQHSEISVISHTNPYPVISSYVLMCVISASKTVCMKKISNQGIGWGFSNSELFFE